MSRIGPIIVSSGCRLQRLRRRDAGRGRDRQRAGASRRTSGGRACGTGGGHTDLVYTITDNVAITTTAQGYDQLNRLLSWVVTPGQGSTASPHNYQYTYDGNGNRTSISADGVASTLGYNAANEWTTDTVNGQTATYSWDADGNELGNDGFGDPAKALAITYDAKNQTASITDTRQNVIPMAYTGAGQAERVTAGWAASNPATPGGPATYSHGSGLVSAADNAGTAYYTRDPSGTLVTAVRAAQRRMAQVH